MSEKEKLYSGEQIFNCYRNVKKCLEPTITPKLSLQYYCSSADIQQLLCSYRITYKMATKLMYVCS